MRKEELVNRINELLEMEHRLSVWQFMQVRKYELHEMVSKIEDLYIRANGLRSSDARSPGPSHYYFDGSRRSSAVRKGGYRR